MTVKAKSRKHAYVVGYDQDRNCVYGKDDHEGKVKFVDPYTLHSARQMLRSFPTIGRKVVLYKLVPVETRIVTQEDYQRWAKPKRNG